jgi:MerR family transcriptional regulator, light-induced transcriptional regulator
MTGHLFSISDTERETGINRDTLRVWERRYGFPTPVRNKRGERTYNNATIERLRLLKQLLDRGMRPGKLVKQETEQLRLLAAQPTVATGLPAEVAELMEILVHGPHSTLPCRMEQSLRRQGLRSFLTELIAPMNSAVGEAWFSGSIGILEEHYYADTVVRVLNAALDALPGGAGNPRVLLTTFPGELHGIGLLMVACVLRLEGAQVLQLGVQTPIEEIVRGALMNRCDVVGLSCSKHLGRRTITAQLYKLRKLSGKIQFFSDLNQLPEAIRTLGQTAI